METGFDRSSEDIGNIVRFGHVNVAVPDQRLAHAFYVTGLGLTRDPYSQTGLKNMWINVGTGQFHLPTGAPMVLRGHVGLVMPDREGLITRLRGIARDLDGTRFSFARHDDRVDVVCPWGNRLHVYEPGPRFAPIWLGIPYVEFEVPVGSADAIARFYAQVMMAPASVADDEDGRVAKISSGQAQQLLFREMRGERPLYDGHHIQIYLAHFSGPHRHLRDLGLLTQEGGRYLYRFCDIKDPATGEVLFTVEHELRSMTHPLFMRPLVNRNPARSVTDYTAGICDDEWSGPPPARPDRAR
jgi:predicted enzyme related to lactoylglutathione lyase